MNRALPGAALVAAALLAVGAPAGRAGELTADAASGGISPVSLLYFADDPCALLTGSEWDAATGQMPARHTADRFRAAGLCQWDLQQPVHQNYLLGQASVQETAWSTIDSEANHRGGLLHIQGKAGFCALALPGPSHAFVYLELTPRWYLGVSTSSCGAAKRLVGLALKRIETLHPAPH
jgi:hypothetical protein